jgi:hypothetical protein
MNAPHAIFSSLLGFAMLSILLVRPAYGECSTDRIKRLNRDGNSVNDIVRRCDMSADDVADALESHDEGTPAPNPTPWPVGGYPSGVPLGSCGCWGPGFSQPDARCLSREAVPQSCGTPCSGGGVAWRGICR